METRHAIGRVFNFADAGVGKGRWRKSTSPGDGIPTDSQCNHRVANTSHSKPETRRKVFGQTIKGIRHEHSTTNTSGTVFRNYAGGVQALKDIQTAQGRHWGATDTDIKNDCKYCARKALEQIEHKE